MSTIITHPRRWAGHIHSTVVDSVPPSFASLEGVGHQPVFVGLRFEDARIGDRKLQLLAEHFSGSLPNGRFHTNHTEWIGVGVHLNY